MVFYVFTFLVFWEQTVWQSWQTMQSRDRFDATPLRILKEGVTPAGQASSHNSQEVQFSAGTLTFQKLKRFIGARIAPIGHRTLQKARLLKITARMTMTNIVSFTRVINGSTENPLVTRFGIVT